MTLVVFLAVIGAALLHATWNAMVKGGVDKRLAMGAVVLGHIPFALVVLPLVPAPSVDSWLYMFAGMALHFGYQLFLMQAYRIGDLTQVYPIARGSAPLIVALISVLLLSVQLSSIELLGIAVIGCGVISLGLARRANGQRNVSAAALALVTSLFIAGYSLVDGHGARLSGSPLSYYSWLTIGNGIAMAIYLIATAPTALVEIGRRQKFVALVGGGASFVAYAIVTWAFTQAPIAMVTALRETSIALAMIIGVIFLRERLNAVKIVATLVILFGAVLLKIAR